MQDVIRKLEIHTLNALLALRQIERATLAERCLSPKLASFEKEAMMRRVDESIDESIQLQRKLALFEGERMLTAHAAN